MTLELMLAATVLTPTVAAGLVVATRRRPDLREACSLAAAAVLVALVVSLVPAVRRGDEVRLELWDVVAGLTLALRLDALGMIFALLAAGLWLITTVYAIGYVRGNAEANQTRFFASFAVCLSAVMGLALADNLLTFFVFYELLTVATYPLVTHKGTPEAAAAGRRYLAYLLTGGAALLLGMATVHSAVGHLDFTAGGFVADHMSRGEIVAVAALFTVGFGSKAAMMPLHRWLPSAMVAPTPVSALLHAVAVVKAGVFGFARVIGHVIGPETLQEAGAAVVLATLASITIVVASLVALFQDNLKRRLAYSTIAHLSYIVLGLSLVTAAGWTGGLFHIVNHAALKITLFFCAGALYVHLRVDRVSQLDGVGRRMPVTLGAFAVASVGLAGLPPMGGFVSKLYLVIGAADAGQPAFVAVMLVSGVLTAGYLFPIVFRAFFRPLAPDSPAAGRGEASMLMVAPLAITAVLGLVLGFGDVAGFFDLATTDASGTFGGSP